MLKIKNPIAFAILAVMIFTLPIYTTLAASYLQNIIVYLPFVVRGQTPTPPTTEPPTTEPPTTEPPTTEPPTTEPPATEPPIRTTGNVIITTIFYNGSGTSEPDEYVEIKNIDTFAIQLSGWTLRDFANHIFTFPSFVIQPNQICRVYTNQDNPETCGFNYHSLSAIWNNSGDTAFLRDSSNALIYEYSYP